MVAKNRISFPDLKPGMVFKTPVFTAEGYKLLEPYTPLAERHLERLKQWEIREIFTEAPPLSSREQKKLRQESEKQVLEPEDITISEGKTKEPELKDRVDHDAVEPACFYDKTDKVFLRSSYGQALERTEELLERLSRGVVGRQHELFQTLRPAFGLIWEYKLLLLYLFHSQKLDQEEYIYTYSLNTALLAMMLADELGYEKEEIRYIGVGGLIHDVGMLIIPRPIRKKEGTFNQREKKIVQGHVKKSENCFRRFSNFDPRLKKTVLQHHEHWDGSGYPLGLKEKQIHPYARIVNLAMTYVAMNQPRYHRKQFGLAHSVREVIYKDKKKFDPEVLKAFVRIVGIYPPGSFIRLSSGHHALVIKNNPSRPLNPVVRVITDANGNRLQEPYRLYLDREKETIESLLDQKSFNYNSFDMA
ncbi:MAG: HD-GYP domain-containing protein [bacterium]